MARWGLMGVSARSGIRGMKWRSRQLLALFFRLSLSGLYEPSAGSKIKSSNNTLSPGASFLGTGSAHTQLNSSLPDYRAEFFAVLDLPKFQDNIHRRNPLIQTIPPSKRPLNESDYRRCRGQAHCATWSTTTARILIHPAQKCPPHAVSDLHCLVYVYTRRLAYFASSWLSSNFLKPASVGPKVAQNPAQVDAEYTTVPIWPVGTPLASHLLSALIAALIRPSLTPNPMTLCSSIHQDINLRLSTSYDIYSDENPHDLPRHTFSDIRFGDWNWTQVWESDFNVPQSVQNNGTLWAVIIVSKKDAQIDPRKPGYKPADVYRKQKLLTRYLPKRNIRKTKNLLGGSEGNTTQENDLIPAEHDSTLSSVISYYHPNLTIGLVSDTNVLPLNRLPPVVHAHVNVPPTSEKDPVSGHYYRYPVVFPNDFWILKESLMPVNDTVTSLHVRVEVAPMSHWKFQLFASMTVAFDQQASKSGGAAEVYCLDEIKRMFIETAPWLLITTFLVSALHAIFEFLAFSSDVSHWRNKKELVGVSLRTILSNIFVQVVVLLYLLDNSEGTSWIILLSSGETDCIKLNTHRGQGTGVVIEAWKITKAVDISFVPRGQGNIKLLPWVKVTDKHVLTEDEQKTQEYDALAFRWVTYVTVPSLFGYTIYSLLYNEHRGWYSFTISTLSSFVYAFGFIELVPQLVINYKLKSVAHMPMKVCDFHNHAMMYKTLNTIVDDFFAFCIKASRSTTISTSTAFTFLFFCLYTWLHMTYKIITLCSCTQLQNKQMPILHRLACFRDDVVFVYWIYKVDYSRVNEFGQSGTDDKKSPDASSSSSTSKSLSEKKNQ
ncbi:hypothetical protein VP01_510g19 [Puccinia sorghi]|uniref:Uncharacterized protein n=1 Tax=Puccinia sorghi TaxID=27349 RepID=A0A0L6ULX7_9BASI|nr:hypothetical protein VP01_510g19 [Puccinia sorghi]